MRFSRSPLLKDLKKRLEQAAAKNSVLLLKSASGSIAEICARTLHTLKTPWLDLSLSSAPLTAGNAGQCRSMDSVCFRSDFARRKLQQRNLAYALERLEKYNLQLIAASPRSLTVLTDAGWEPALVARLGGRGWRFLRFGHADDVPEIASLVLSHLVERNEVPSRQFSSAALNALRLHHWEGEWAELLSAVKNLALVALEEDISVEDIETLLSREVTDAPKQPPALPMFNQPLRDAREEFRAHVFRTPPQDRTRQHDPRRR